MEVLRERVEPEQKYRNGLAKIGIAEIVIGSLSFCLALIGIAFSLVFFRQLDYYKKNSYFQSDFGIVLVAPGTWCGVITVLCGCQAVRTRNRPTLKAFKFSLILSGASFVAMVTLLTMSIVTGITLNYHNEIFVVQWLTAVTSFFGLIISVVHLFHCCAGAMGLKNYRKMHDSEYS